MRTYKNKTMIIAYIGIALYFFFVMFHVALQLRNDKKKESLRFHHYLNSLKTKGFPRHQSGAWMNVDELYNHWKNISAEG